MAVTAQQVNELRNKTGAGLMDCKKALTEANGDIDAAIDYLRKKGAKVAELRAGRAASEGVVIAKTTADQQRGVIVYLSCETDFVAKNEDFRAFADQITDIALHQQAADLDQLLAMSIDGTKIADKIQERVSAIGELITIAAFENLSGASIVAYNHMGNKIGVLVALSQSGCDAVGKDVAMQIAAMNPIALDAAGVSKEVLEREMAIAKEKALASGKPENIIQKIAESAVNSYIKENTLLTQPFVKDGSKTVQQVLGEAASGLTLTAFKRVSLGLK